MLARWTVTYGPEFERSRAECNLPVERLQLHLNDFRLSLERDPLTVGEAYGDSACVLEAKDYAFSTLLTIYVVLYDGLVAEIRWVAESSLSDDDLGPLGLA